MADNVNVLSNDLRGIVRREVDFIPGAWVDFYDDVTVGQIRKAQKTQTENIDASLDLIISQIADWNFADGENKKLPVNIDSLSRLSSKILTWISTVQSEVLTQIESKKKDSPENL